MPAMRQRDRQLEVRPTGTLEASAARRHRRRSGSSSAGRRGTAPSSSMRRVRVTGSPEDGEGRRVLDDQAAVPVLAPGQQQVQRRGQVRRALEVVQPPVGDQAPPRRSGARLFGQRLGQRRHQLSVPGRPRRRPPVDAAQLGILRAPDPASSVRAASAVCAGRSAERWRRFRPPPSARCRTAARGPPAGATGCASAASSTSRRQPAQAQPDSPRHSASAPRPAASARAASPAAITGQGSSGSKTTRCKRALHPGHWPSLSSSAGTCTWSDL
jgi:hypothetical protein